MKKIKSITKEQEDKIPIFNKKWLDMCYGKTDLEAAKKLVYDLYELIGEKKPMVSFGDSPYSTILMTEVLSGKGNKKLSDQLRSQLSDQLRDQLWDQLWYQLRSQLSDQLRDQLWDQLFWAQLGDQLRSQLGVQLRSQLWDDLSKKNRSVFTDNTIFLYYYISYMSCYYFAKHIGVKFDQKKYDLFERLHNCPIIIPFKGICFVSKKPTELFFNDKGLLHNNKAPAVKYSDGFSLYSLNGIKVPKYLVETPADKLDIQFFLKEKNADIKAEFIKKYGIDRMESLGKSVDSWKNYKGNEVYKNSMYELIDINDIFTSIDYAPYLKMKNPTTGAFHLEGVSPECKNINDAMEFRTKVKIPDIIAVK